MTALRNIIWGVGTNPRVVAAARMLALYALPLLIQAYVAWAAGLTDPRWLGIPVASIVMMRAVGEAVIDELKKQKLGIGNEPDATGG